jgi:hypothetical protein
MRDVDCAIYTDFAGSGEALAELAGGADAVTVRPNPDFHEERRLEFPWGFMQFPHVIDVRPTAPGHVELVSSILQRLWGAGVPAVAACEYEDQLPELGGYRSRAVPWPQ